MSKILILANSDIGLYRFRKELIDALSETNEVILFLPYGKCIDYFTSRGCAFIDAALDRRGVNPFSELRLFSSYLRTIKKIKPDMVITYTVKPGIYGGSAARLFGIPYHINITGLGSVFERGGVLSRTVSLMYKFACKKAGTVFFENSANRDFFVSSGLVRKEQCRVLNGAGVNLEEYPVREYPRGDTTRFLFIGRIMAEKGIGELCSAMRKLVSDGLPVALDILGGYEEDYSDLFESGSREGWLFYHDFQSDILPFIRNAHCFVLPSWHEGMANTNLECAASGRPLITSDIPGCREAVVEGKSGFLVERKNPEALYLAMKSFCGLSYDERREMGLAGRKHMENAFDRKNVVRETVSRLNDIECI